MAQKQRLDVVMVQRSLVDSREKAQALIMAGEVLVDDVPATKPGRLVGPEVAIRLRQGLAYVSRGGLKLEAALAAFAVDPAGLVAADVGASTGGFTDCLLQHGAAHVYTIDVGYGQLAWQLRQDSRVTVLERTNVRHLERLPEDALVDLVAVDVSFIGLRLVLPAVSRILRPTGSVIALIKPQFEAGRQQVGKGGVVKDSQVHRQVLLDLLQWARDNGWGVSGLIRSPITGPAGNVEFLCLLRCHHEGSAADLEELVASVIET